MVDSTAWREPRRPLESDGGTQLHGAVQDLHLLVPDAGERCVGNAISTAPVLLETEVFRFARLWR
jgi:hypothetical protein